MYKLILKISLLGLLVISLGYTILAISIKYYPDIIFGDRSEYAMWSFQKEAMSCKYNVKLNAIIGDSRGMASLNPLYLANSYRNFSMGGCTFFEGYITLKRLLKNNKLDTLILCYGPSHFEKSNCLEERTLAYNFINLEDLNQLQNVEKQFNQVLDDNDFGTLTFQRQLIRFGKIKQFPLMWRETFINALSFNKSINISDRIEEMKLNKGHTLFGREISADGLSVEAERKDFYYNKVVLSYLDSINTLVLENNLRSFLIIPPFNTSTFRAVNKTNYFNSFSKTIELIKKKYPKMTIIYDSPFLANNMFGDPAHLNASGAKIFSTNIKGIISNPAISLEK